MNPQRSITTAILTVVLVGWISGRVAGSETGVRRFIAAMVGGVMLLILSEAAPKLAVGFAWLMAIAVIAEDRGGAFKTLSKTLGAKSK